jgi:hypothetical protein
MIIEIVHVMEYQMNFQVQDRNFQVLLMMHMDHDNKILQEKI